MAAVERVAHLPEAQLDASRRDERVRVARVELRHLLEVPEGLLVLVFGEECVAHPQEGVEVLGLLPQDGGEALSRLLEVVAELEQRTEMQVRPDMVLVDRESGPERLLGLRVLSKEKEHEPHVGVGARELRLDGSAHCGIPQRAVEVVRLLEDEAEDPAVGAAALSGRVQRPFAQQPRLVPSSPRSTAAGPRLDQAREARRARRR